MIVSNDAVRQRARHAVAVKALVVLLTLLTMESPAGADSFLERRNALPATVAMPFPRNHCHEDIIPPTILDNRSFCQINEIQGAKIIDNVPGWAVEARTGGRPFLCFDTIRVNSANVLFDSTMFSLPEAGAHCKGWEDIPPKELTAHVTAGTTVNRLWFLHTSSNDHFPVVVMFTPDGFFNIGAADRPKLQGAAIRVGFIGEQFGALDGPHDDLQHADNLNIMEIDNDSLLLLFNIHPEAGEGVIEVELRVLCTFAFMSCMT